jgi:hypothetical protein
VALLKVYDHGHALFVQLANEELSPCICGIFWISTARFMRFDALGIPFTLLFD